MKQCGVIFGAGLLVLLLAFQANARPDKRYDKTTETCRMLNQGQNDWDSQPWGKGAQVFKQSCKSCHYRGNDKGAPFLWAESKTSKGWNRVFYKKYPKCAKQGDWAGLTIDNQLKLNDYLYRWSADSRDINDNC